MKKNVVDQILNSVEIILNQKSLNLDTILDKFLPSIEADACGPCVSYYWSTSCSETCQPLAWCSGYSWCPTHRSCLSIKMCKRLHGGAPDCPAGGPNSSQTGWQLC